MQGKEQVPQGGEGSLHLDPDVANPIVVCATPAAPRLGCAHGDIKILSWNIAGLSAKFFNL